MSQIVSNASPVNYGIMIHVHIESLSEYDAHFN